MIYSFKNDYSSIAHPLVLEKLLSCANEQNSGYGTDIHTENAKKLIQEKIGKDSDIYFLVGGTQTNMTVISTILRPFEAVLCADTGHINVHETGAIEGQGHKVIGIKNTNGKITPEDIERVLVPYGDCHMVYPKMVYISESTEVGSVYTKEELKEMYAYCQKKGFYLFIDGARLASGMAATGVTFEDLGNYSDIFYIGGTKNGGYLGEAVVINNQKLAENFDFAVKHFGALLAKGFVGSIPFEVLMEGDLYLSIGEKENACAKILSDGMKKLGYQFLSDSNTNQIFPIVPVSLVQELQERYGCELWEKLNDEFYAIRFVTSFTTTENNCKEVLDFLAKK